MNATPADPNYIITTSSVAQTADAGRPTDLELLASRHDFALLVTSERTDGIVVQQVYASLSSAERKVARTRERGLSATMTLVRLVPVPYAIIEPEGAGPRP